MQTYLILGGSGLVGTYLLQQLNNEDKINIIAPSHTTLDVTNFDSIVQFIEHTKIDIIINASAYTNVNSAEFEIDVARGVNEIGVHNLARIARFLDIPIIHISTDYVFSGNKTTFYNEDDIPDPLNVYGRTKFNGEVLLRKTSNKFIILRTSWAFGEYGGNNFVKGMLRLGKKSDRLEVVSDQFGGPTYAGDIARALIKIAKDVLNGNVNFGIYHFSGYPYVSWFEFAQVIFFEAVSQKILERKPSIYAVDSKHFSGMPIRPSNSRLELRKIREVFNISPSDWQKALKNIKSYI